MLLACFFCTKSNTTFIVPRSCRNPRSLRRLLVEEQEQALEFQRRHLAALQLTQKSLSINMDGLKVSDGEWRHGLHIRKFHYISPFLSSLPSCIFVQIQIFPLQIISMSTLQNLSVMSQTTNLAIQMPITLMRTGMNQSLIAFPS